MKIERFIALGYLFLGISFGVVSNYFTKSSSGLTFALSFPLFAYFISLLPLLKFVKQKKKTWLFYNSFITFFLIWLIVWILLYNL
jgi:Mn2+/Fe2+ NRAMP family transporter